MDRKFLRDAADDDCEQHGSWRIPRRIWHFLGHVQDNIESNEGQSRLQHTKDPSNTIRPACLVTKLRENVLSVRLLRCGKENADDDNG